MRTRLMFESTVPKKFKGIKCAKCETELAVGAPCRVQTDVSGWLLWAECVECPKSFAPVAQLD
jgi:RNase P subunit RPR2